MNSVGSGAGCSPSPPLPMHMVATVAWLSVFNGELLVCCWWGIDLTRPDGPPLVTGINSAGPPLGRVRDNLPFEERLGLAWG
jgi:hypothetical protein